MSKVKEFLSFLTCVYWSWFTGDLVFCIFTGSITGDDVKKYLIVNLSVVVIVFLLAALEQPKQKRGASYVVKRSIR